MLLETISIRKKTLIVTILVALVPLTFLGAIAVTVLTEDNFLRIQASAKRLNQKSSHLIDDFIRRQGRLLSELATRIAEQGSQSLQIKKLREQLLPFGNQKTQLQFDSTIRVFDTNGTEIVAVPNFIVTGISIQTKRIYKNLMQKAETGKIVHSSMYRHPDTHVDSFTMMSSLKDQRSQRNVGFIAIDIDLRNIINLIVGKYLATDAHSFIVGKWGESYLLEGDAKLISYDQIRKLMPDMSKIIANRYNDKNRSVNRYQDRSGKEYLAFSHFHPGLGWSVFTTVPQSILTTNLNRIRLHSFLIVVIIGLLSIPFAYWLSGKITNRILQLDKAAKVISSGFYNEKLEIHGRDEIANLGQTLESMRERIQGFAEKMQTMVDERTSLLFIEQKKIREILNHLQQGVLTFDENFIIGDEFSRYLTEIFQVSCDELHQMSVVDLIFSNSTLPSSLQKRAVSVLNSIIGYDLIAWQLNHEHLMSEITIERNQTRRYLALNWIPIVDERSVVVKILLTIRDETDQKYLQEKFQEQKRDLQEKSEIIMQLIQFPRHSLGKFFSNTSLQIKQALDLCKSQKHETQLRILLHTIKGNCAAFKLDLIVNLLHISESLQNESPTDNQELLEKLNRVANEFNKYLSVFDSYLSKSDQTGYASLLEIVTPQLEKIKTRLKEYGKNLESIIVKDDVMIWSEGMQRLVADMIMHSLSNAVEHGFIKPAQDNLPTQAPRLSVTAVNKLANLIVTISDNGVGIDWKKLKQQAKKQNMINFDPHELIELLFVEGFSTNDQTHKHSGRGVGLAAIRIMAEKHGGSVKLEPGKDAGVKLEITLPMAINEEVAA